MHGDQPTDPATLAVLVTAVDRQIADFDNNSASHLSSHAGQKAELTGTR